MKIAVSLKVVRSILPLILMPFLLLPLLTVRGIPSAEEQVKANIFFKDDFSGGTLDNDNWVVTREGDFKESTIDVYDADPGEKEDYRLLLRANTIGTRDDTVKFHGVRSSREFDFSKGVEIDVHIDWNNQANGSYLTAGLYISPTITGGNPRRERDWLMFEYVGVPPGRNARSVIAASVNGAVKYLDTEGWPRQREGRPISYQKLTIILDAQKLKIIENGKDFYSTQSHGLKFTSGYLYLQMSSHSNYPAREVYFDNITVKPILSPQ